MRGCNCVGGKLERVSSADYVALGSAGFHCSDLLLRRYPCARLGQFQRAEETAAPHVLRDVADDPLILVEVVQVLAHHEVTLDEVREPTSLTAQRCEARIL